jgi:hypothetical protein
MTKKMFSIFAVLMVVLVAFIGVRSQSTTMPTPVQNSPWELRAINTGCTATGAGNTSVVCTITAPSSYYIYVSNCTVHEVANAAVTGAAGPAGVITTAGLGTNYVWWSENGTLTTGQWKEVMKEQWGFGLKTVAPGTNFTLTWSGGQATESVRINCMAWTNPQ